MQIQVISVQITARYLLEYYSFADFRCTKLCRLCYATGNQLAYQGQSTTRVTSYISNKWRESESLIRSETVVF